jgi:hypothetical protein
MFLQLDMEAVVPEDALRGEQATRLLAREEQQKLAERGIGKEVAHDREPEMRKV